MNILLIIAAIAFLYKFVDGYKKGMVREIISLISMIVLCVVAGLIALGAKGYMERNIGGIILSVLLLFLIGIIHHFLGVVFFSAKAVTKLPVIHFADKLLGSVFGVFEVVLILWTVYTFLMLGNVGVIGGIINNYTAGSRILSWIYQHNWLAYGIERIISDSTVFHGV